MKNGYSISHYCFKIQVQYQYHNPVSKNGMPTILRNLSNGFLISTPKWSQGSGPEYARRKL